MARATPLAKGQVEFHGSAVWCPRLVFCAVAGVYLFLIGIAAERWHRLGTRGNAELLQLRDQRIPNYHHIVNDRDLLYDLKGRGSLNQFGQDYLDLQGNWQILCHMDSDHDGQNNGQELGDPCCRWEAAPPHEAFSLTKNREFRRWHVTNPGNNLSNWQSTLVPFTEPNCSAADYTSNISVYEHAYYKFYYRGVRHPIKCDPPLAKHMVGVGATGALFLHWIRSHGLLWDLVPVFGDRRPQRVGTLLATGMVAFWFMDLLSGMAHLCLDYAPNWIPIVGPVANGFQLHHRQPGLLARKRIWNQVNDVFIIMPGPVLFLIGLNPSRPTRLFYFWCICFAFLFLMAHPWAHMHEDMVPRLVAIAQGWGVLLNQDAHRRHHEDLESQFTILSGHSDFIIDHLSQLVTPQRYDIWLFFLVTWLLLPVMLDIKYRDFMTRMALSTAGIADDKSTSVAAV